MVERDVVAPRVTGLPADPTTAVDTAAGSATTGPTGDRVGTTDPMESGAPVPDAVVRGTQADAPVTAPTAEALVRMADQVRAGLMATAPTDVALGSVATQPIARSAASATVPVMTAPVMTAPVMTAPVMTVLAMIGPMVSAPMVTARPDATTDHTAQLADAIAVGRRAQVATDTQQMAGLPMVAAMTLIASQRIDRRMATAAPAAHVPTVAATKRALNAAMTGRTDRDRAVAIVDPMGHVLRQVRAGLAARRARTVTGVRAATVPRVATGSSVAMTGALTDAPVGRNAGSAEATARARNVVDRTEPPAVMAGLAADAMRGVVVSSAAAGRDSMTV